MNDAPSALAGHHTVTMNPALGVYLDPRDAVRDPDVSPSVRPCGDQAGVLCAAFRALPAAAAVLEVDGTVLVWNATAEALLGWSEQELAGTRALPMIWPKGELSSLYDGLPGVDLWSARMRHRNGARVPVRVRTARLDAGGGAHGMVMLMEATRVHPSLQPPPESGIIRMVRRREGAVEERLRAALAGARYLRALQPGERLPPIRDLAAAAGVSSRPVLAAYRSLAAEGTVDVLGRRGTVLAENAAGPEQECETGEWLVRAVVDAYGLQMKVPQLPELVRRWTSTVPLVCACVESCEDDLVALEEDVARSWGMEPRRVDPTSNGAALADALSGADVVVTTAFHAPEVRRALRGSSTAVLTASLHPRVCQAVARALRDGELAAVVADREFGLRLAGFAHSERLRVIEANDAAAVAALDPGAVVLMTRAARQRLRGAARLLVAPSFMLVPDDPAALARVLIRRNRQVERLAARATRAV